MLEINQKQISQDDYNAFIKLSQHGNTTLRLCPKEFISPNSCVYLLKEIKFHPRYLNARNIQQAKEVTYNQFKDQDFIQIQQVFHHHKNNSLIFVSEYYQSKNLKLFLRQQKIYDYQRNIQIALQLVSAIKKLHARNTYHASLQPQNILVDQKLKVRVADFGIKFLQKIKNQNFSEAKKLFLAPEVQQNEDYSFKSDIWSLGMILLEIFFQFNQRQQKKLFLLKKGQISYEEFEKYCWKLSNRRLINLIYLMLSHKPSNRLSIEQVNRQLTEISQNKQSQFVQIIHQLIDKNLFIVPSFKEQSNQFLQQNFTFVDNDSQKYPYRCVGLILSTFKKKKKYGTGFLVAPNLVLTCGHNIFLRQIIGYDAKEIIFVINNRRIKAKSWFVSDNFRGDFSEMSSNDFGLVVLTENVDIGKGFQFLVDYNQLSEFKDVELVGFRQHLDQASNVSYVKYKHKNKLIKNRGTNFLEHNIQTVEGESGSPIFLDVAENQFYLIGIHIGVQEDIKHATKMTNQKIFYLEKWIEQSTNQKVKLKKINFENIKLPKVKFDKNKIYLSIQQKIQYLKEQLSEIAIKKDQKIGSNEFRTCLNRYRSCLKELIAKYVINRNIKQSQLYCKKLKKLLFYQMNLPFKDEITNYNQISICFQIIAGAYFDFNKDATVFGKSQLLKEGYQYYLLSLLIIKIKLNGEDIQQLTLRYQNYFGLHKICKYLKRDRQVKIWQNQMRNCQNKIQKYHSLNQEKLNTDQQTKKNALSCICVKDLFCSKAGEETLNNLKELLKLAETDGQRQSLLFLISINYLNTHEFKEALNYLVESTMYVAQYKNQNTAPFLQLQKHFQNFIESLCKNYPKKQTNLGTLRQTFTYALRIAQKYFPKCKYQIIILKTTIGSL